MTESSVTESPLYRVIYDDILREIESGMLPGGTKLPSIRDFADARKVSVGTIRHVYNMLSHDGFIEQQRGRGTFVLSTSAESDVVSRKEKALAAIDKMIDDLSSLGFTTREAQIFFELRLRQKEDMTRPIRVAVVAATSEERSIMAQSLDTVRIANTFRVPFDDVLAHPGRLTAGYDLVVTPERLYKELKLITPDHIQVMPAVLELSQASASACMDLPAHVTIGFLTVSLGFAEVLQDSCERYIPEPLQVKRAVFGNPDVTCGFIDQADVIALAPDYENLIDAKETAIIHEYMHAGKVFIESEFSCDKGSLLYISNAIERSFRDLRESLHS